MAQFLQFTSPLSARDLKSIQAGRVLTTSIQVTLPNTRHLPPRYDIAVVDCDAYKAGPCCVLIIPQGRECEFSFSNDEGRLELAKSAGFQRMIFVALGRNHKFKNLQSIQNELNSFMRQLAPGKLASSASASFPYVTPSSDEDIGSRVEVCTGKSEFSGDWVIEEVPDLTWDPPSPSSSSASSGITSPEAKSALLRRLIFLSNRALIQSEARRLVYDSSSAPVASAAADSSAFAVAASAAAAVFDFSYLACGHHSAMVAGFAWCQALTTLAALTSASSTTIHAALIGLGGGLFSMYLHEAFPQLHLDCVELDPEIVNIASDHFGFQKQSSRLTVFVQDGLEYVRQRSGLFLTSPVPAPSSSSSSSISSSISPLESISELKETLPYLSSSMFHQQKLDILMIDVDSKNLSAGLSCPPEPFVDADFFRSIHFALKPRGVFLLNLVCRAKELFATIVNRARACFRHVLQLPVPGDVNVVLICVAHDHSAGDSNSSEQSARDESKSSSSPTQHSPNAAAIRKLIQPSMGKSIDIESLVAAVKSTEPASSSPVSDSSAAVSSSSSSSSLSSSSKKKKKK